MKSIWLVESEPDYQDFLKSAQARHPRVTRPRMGLRAGDSTVARTALLAEERNGILYVGVRLNSDDEFWKPWEGNFIDLVEKTVHDGSVLIGGKWISVTVLPDAIRRLEFCASHVGSVTIAIMRDSTKVIIDEG